MGNVIGLRSCASSSTPALQVAPNVSGCALLEEADLRLDAVRQLMLTFSCMHVGANCSDPMGTKDLAALGTVAHMMLSDVQDLFTEGQRRIACEQEPAAAPSTSEPLRQRPVMLSEQAGTERREVAHG